MQKTVLVTGASRGIGRAIARCFAKQQLNIAVNYNQSRREAEELQAEIQAGGNPNILLCKADVSDRVQVEAMVKSVTERFGAVDILVNNAGIALQKLFTDTTAEEWGRMFDVHVNGMFHCTQAVLPQMIHRKSGCIVNLSSMWGVTGASCEVAYSSAKAAVIGFTKSLAKELAPSGITVNCVAPGAIETEMVTALGTDTIHLLEEEIPAGRLGTPEQVAGAVCFLASDAAAYITGETLNVNGGMVT